MNCLHLWSELLCIVAVIGTTFGCIYTHPQQVTGYAGTQLTYICEANCGEKFWKLNDSFVSVGKEPYQATIEVSGQRSALSVEASAATNNTAVTCFLFDPPNNVESSVNIIVQGTTAEPGDLLAHYNENYVNLSWTQPYILPDTELIGYEVNVSTERNISLFSTTGTNLSFLYTALDLYPCPLNQSVDIFIAGVNEAGVGEPAIVQVLVIQTQTEDCTKAFIPLGAPINATAVFEGNSVLVSWQPPPFTLPSDIFGYKLMINISTSQDPFTNLMAQTVSTNQTFFIIPLTSFGINKCNGEYSFVEVGVTALDLTNREGETALATVGVACKSTTTENQELQTTFKSDGRTLSDSSVIWIVVGVTVTGVVITLLAIGVSVVIILRRHRPKIPATPKQKRNRNASMSDNNAYGVNNLMALNTNGAYSCEINDLDPHLYEEIGGKKAS